MCSKREVSSPPSSAPSGSEAALPYTGATGKKLTSYSCLGCSGARCGAFAPSDTSRNCPRPGVGPRGPWEVLQGQVAELGGLQQKSWSGNWSQQDPSQELETEPTPTILSPGESLKVGAAHAGLGPQEELAEGSLSLAVAGSDGPVADIGGALGESICLKSERLL